MAIIGLLIALLLPAVQQSRESARAASCKNNLRQLGLATQLFHDTYKVFPPANIKPRPSDPPELNCGGREPSWLVRIMPYLEQTAFYQQWNLFEPYESHPEATRGTSVTTLVCPSRRQSNNANAPDQTIIYPMICGCVGPQIIYGGATSDYAGNLGDPSPGATGSDSDFFFGGNGTGVIIASRPRCEAGKPADWIDRISSASIVDGLSSTILIGEAHVPLGKLNQSPFNGPTYSGNHFSAFARVGGPGVPIADRRSTSGIDSYAFGSWHVGGCNFAFADSSIHNVSPQIATSILGNLCHRSDNTAISEIP